MLEVVGGRCWFGNSVTLGFRWKRKRTLSRGSWGKIGLKISEKSCNVTSLANDLSRAFGDKVEVLLFCV